MKRLQCISAIVALSLFAVLGTQAAEPFRITTMQLLCAPFALQSDEIVTQLNLASGPSALIFSL